MGMIKNSGVIIFGIIVGNILAFVFHFYVGRALGAADYGVFGALVALYTILSLPSTAFGSAVTKFTARLNEKKEYGKIGYLRKIMQNKMLIFGAIVLLLMIIFSSYIASYLKIDSNIPIIVTGIMLVFGLISPINRGVLQGMKKFRDYSINGILEGIVRLGLIFVLLFFGFGINGTLLAYGLAYFAAFIAIFPLIKETKKQEKFKIEGFYKFALLVFIVNIIMQLIIYSPTFFIKHYFSSEFTGYWTAALTLSRVSLFIAGGITIVMFPEVASRTELKEQRKIFWKALLLTIIGAVFVELIFLIFGKLAILILYGKSFLPAVPLLYWLGLAMIPLAVIQLGLSYWLAGREVKG